MTHDEALAIARKVLETASYGAPRPLEDVLAEALVKYEDPLSVERAVLEAPIEELRDCVTARLKVDPPDATFSLTLSQLDHILREFAATLKQLHSARQQLRGLELTTARLRTEDRFKHASLRGNSG